MSAPYHKIPNVYRRQPDGERKLIFGEYATPELKALRNADWYATEKVDGMNIRVIYDGENVRFAGRTDRANIPPALFERLHCLFPTHVLGQVFDGPVTLYGEGYGGNIQKKGKEYRENPDFILFDVYCGGLWLERHNVNEIAELLHIRRVPYLKSSSTLSEWVDWMQLGLVPDSGVSIYPDVKPEGIVLRPDGELLDRRGNRIIAKLRLEDFA